MEAPKEKEEAVEEKKEEAVEVRLQETIASRFAITDHIYSMNRPQLPKLPLEYICWSDSIRLHIVSQSKTPLFSFISFLFPSPYAFS